MNKNQYLKYSEARKASFARKITVEQFKEWLTMGNEIDCDFSLIAIEIFQYLAYETVAQVCHK